MKTEDAPAAEKLTVGKNYVRNRGLMGIALFLGWLILFFMGLSISSSKLKPLDTDGHVIWETLWLYALTFTPTNTALLAALAGVIGGWPVTSVPLTKNLILTLMRWITIRSNTGVWFT
ncbi:hypothetical protein [Larkinella arboricola]